jgi:hypothetical protein
MLQEIDIESPILEAQISYNDLLLKNGIGSPVEFIDGKPTELFISPQAYKYICKNIPERTELIANQLQINLEGNYAGGHMEAVLAKALIPTAIGPSVDMINQMVEDLAPQKDDSDIQILESGTGAGLMTTHTYFSVKKKNPGSNVRINTIDYSAESIATASLVFELHGIPYKIIRDDENIPEDFVDGIILRQGKFADVTQKDIEQDVIYDAIYSDHGTAYDTISQKQTLDNMVTLAESSGAKIYISALDKEVIFDLDKLHKVSEVLLALFKERKNFSDSDIETVLREGEVVNTDGESEKIIQIVVRKMFTQPAFLLYKLIGTLKFSSHKSSKEDAEIISTAIDRSTEEARRLVQKEPLVALRDSLALIAGRYIAAEVHTTNKKDLHQNSSNHGYASNVKVKLHPHAQATERTTITVKN